MAQFTDEPRLVLYDFHSWMDLWQYLACHDHLTALRHSADRIGRWLGALHRSQVMFRGTEPNVVEDPMNLSGAERNLAALPGGIGPGHAVSFCPAAPLRAG